VRLLRRERSQRHIRINKGLSVVELIGEIAQINKKYPYIRIQVNQEIKRRPAQAAGRQNQY
jgi:hypothetical protein